MIYIEVTVNYVADLCTRLIYEARDHIQQGSEALALALLLSDTPR